MPVSSLRLEALRDGLADKEYLKLATELAGAKAVAPIIRTITWYPYPIKYGHIFKFPKYVSSASSFAAARAKLAAVIEQAE